MAEEVGASTSGGAPGGGGSAAGIGGGGDHRWFDRAVRRSLKREQEDQLLESAKAVRDGMQRKMGRGARNFITTKPLPAFPEPKRNKTHWDYLMDEMVWLSKEFQKERKWKQSQCRKFARLVERSKLDVESRRVRRQEEEKLAIRKTAAGLSRMVMTWWSKVERVVVHKQQYEVEKIEKHRLDRRLDKLVAKTERCSKLLASRVNSFMHHQGQQEQSQSQSQNATPAPSASAGGAASGGKDKGKGADTASMGTLHSQPRSQRRVTFREADEMSDVISTSRTLDQIFKDEATDGDYEMREGDEESVDDETTMIEEERRAAREGRGAASQSTQHELVALQNETEMPIEEVLKRYYASMDAAAAEGGGEAGEPDEARGGAEASGSGREAAASDGAPVGTKPGSDADVEAVFKEERNDTDYEMSEDELDDEGTFAEEERLARKEGNVKQQEALELNALQKESEVPLEELLAQYRGQACNGESSHKGEGGEDEDGERNEEIEAVFKEERNDTDYEMSEDEVDDEGTFAEEERLARKEGNVKQQEALELDALQKESEVPLEELLTQYREQMDKGDAREDEPEPEQARPMTRKRKADSMLSSETERQSLDSERDRSQVSSEGGGAAVDEFKPPFLLKYSLREYQMVGLQWMAALRQKSLNGILADEMGLGKTIQTIALLADLACNHGYWGPHLIVVPTSVMLNWEMEFKKWCPAFKILTYFGTAKERQAKRQGWSKFNSFHVCITTYTLILQDKNMFRRKKWDYLILDEAHMIKNWQSQRWQTLLRFHARRRVLLTGTPLQNNLMELWSLMHFLMPKIFESHDEFKEWFNNPLTNAVEGQASLSRQLVKRLHGILRPFILRRLKAEVEKKLPGKVEHLVYCKLSKRQRNLYEDYVGNKDTQSTLSSGNYFGIFNVLMQLRKVCNHPDLFEGRAIKSAFDAQSLSVRYPSVCIVDMNSGPSVSPNLCDFGLIEPALGGLASWDWDFIEGHKASPDVFANFQGYKDRKRHPKWLRPSAGGSPESPLARLLLASAAKAKDWRKSRGLFFAALNAVRCARRPAYTRDLIERATIRKKSDLLAGCEPWVASFEDRSEGCAEMVNNFVFVVPKARASLPDLWCSHAFWKKVYDLDCPEDFSRSARAVIHSFHNVAVRLRLFFPDRRLVQFDCGKLQQLAVLLQKLKAGGHRVLIFTQMSKMLDILESFLNLYSYTYFRLDGATKPEQRQAYTQRFNTDKKIFAFILSTRSGGVGINLTGADTVIFYDSDWNPAMDHQAQDRCHRIGQTREVHIYRFVTKHTVEENIMKKSNQKRHLDHLAIQSGEFNVDFLTSPQALLGAGGEGEGGEGKAGGGMSAKDIRDALNCAEDDDDREAAKVAEREAEADLAEFVSEGSALDAADGDGDGDGKAAGGPSSVKPEKPDKPEDELGNGFDFEALAKLLNPVDLYAIRFYENLYPFNPHDFVKVADVDAPQPAAARAGAGQQLPVEAEDSAKVPAGDGDGDDDLNIQEFNEELDTQELNVVSDWDPRRAEQVYRANVVE